MYFCKFSQFGNEERASMKNKKIQNVLATNKNNYTTSLVKYFIWKMNSMAVKHFNNNAYRKLVQF